ncbi:aminotransferase class I/II-fold pyridoxal phosphate-dependent enzyme [Siculibacillus lacustris]|uniref:Aminotransferase class I/II-fold pyridoxal phosphate-dependent enzyme n=1 Tax=Siculibacillus lacustris TaxID=1549641 RepID=A0A4Q9VTV0_9HYPH|nr:aminotransferase class I/II-fold pyridoxal phosphate-dependent enzyme [Siculibacillus lacustris]TBW39548.1 aminotransferase class I/II-fold pyridoxal phosphate-dependent enzyme [Siculibacillus lacustris]
MTPADDSPLSDAELARLLDAMQTGPQALAADRGARRRHVATPSFEGHPLWREMRLHREVATAIGVEDPYYRSHAGRAGATSTIDGRAVINFASYDYLGLNGHPEIVAATADATARFGTSVSASRISAGERPIHRALETALAANYEAEDAIAFVSGHAGAVSTLATLMGPADLIVHDAVIHNCIVVGAQLSGAKRRLFPHNDLEALDEILAQERDRVERVLVVSEGLFSMDGDGPDLARLIELKTRWGAHLMIDDAHGLGVLGARGRGLHEYQGVDPAGVDLWLGTLSKTLVSCGGYVAANGVVVDILKHHAPGFVYSVGMPAAVAAASVAALDLMNREPERVARLQSLSRRLRDGLAAVGLDVGTSWGLGIVPVIVGDTLRTVRLAQALLERGINAFPVLPPGVPEKSARLRFFVNASHDAAQIDAAIDATVDEARRLGVVAEA